MSCDLCCEMVQDLIQCDRCNNDWCLECDTRLDKCPYCRLPYNNPNLIPPQPPVFIRQDAYLE